MRDQDLVRAIGAIAVITDGSLLRDLLVPIGYQSAA
jgi:hypothetical protein